MPYRPLILILALLILPLHTKEDPDKVNLEDWVDIYNELEDKDEFKKIYDQINSQNPKSTKKTMDEDQQDFYEAEKLFVAGKKKMVNQDYLTARGLFKQAMNLWKHKDDYRYFYRLTFFPEIITRSDLPGYDPASHTKVNFTFNYQQQEAMKNWLSNWTFYIKDQAGTLYFEQDGILMVPSGISWPMTDRENNKAPLGTYQAWFLCKGDYFTRFESKKYNFTLGKAITPVETKTEVRLTVDNIYFDFDSARLKTQSHSVIDQVVQILNKYPGKTVMIMGHADHIGTDEYNFDLSRRRAWSIWHNITSKNNSKAGGFELYGIGESQPLGTNRGKNRRVEFIIIKEAADRPDQNLDSYRFTSDSYNVNNYLKTKSAVISPKRLSSYKNKYQELKQAILNGTPASDDRGTMRKVFQTYIHQGKYRDMIDMIGVPACDLDYYYKGLAIHLLSMKYSGKPARVVDMNLGAGELLRLAALNAEEDKVKYSAKYWQARTIEWSTHPGIGRIKAARLYEEIVNNKDKVNKNILSKARSNYERLSKLLF